MTTTTQHPATQPDKNPDHDQQAAGLHQAMALRFYTRFVDARRKAVFRGADLADYGTLPTQRDVTKAYRRLAEAWVKETPSTLDAVIALVQFAGVIAADKLLTETIGDSGPVSDETDALHQTIALAAASTFLNERAMSEWLDRRRAAYGPTAMPAHTGEGGAP